MELSALIGGCFADVVRDRLRGRAVQTLIDLGRHLQNFDSKDNSVLQKELLRKSLMDHLRLTQQVQRTKQQQQQQPCIQEA